MALQNPTYINNNIRKKNISIYLYMYVSVGKKMSSKNEPRISNVGEFGELCWFQRGMNWMLVLVVELIVSFSWVIRSWSWIDCRWSNRLLSKSGTEKSSVTSTDYSKLPRQHFWNWIWTRSFFLDEVFDSVLDQKLWIRLWVSKIRYPTLSGWKRNLPRKIRFLNFRTGT